MPHELAALRGLTAALLLASALALPGVACTPATACGTTPPRPRADQAWAIERAVMVEGRLWLLTDTGALSSLAEGESKRVTEPLSEPVLDVCRRGDALVALTGRADGCGAITVRRWQRGTWKQEATLPMKDEGLIALSCDGQQTALLTSRRLLVLNAGGAVAATKLAEPLNGGAVGVTTMHLAEKHAFLGIDAGEWGGGLLRIDRRSGALSSIEKNASGELCGGPLNSACDPVNAIVASPWQAGCVVAAIGLVHFSPHGRVVEVCGDSVRRVYVRPYGEQPPPRPGQPASRDDEPFSTVAFFGLEATADAVWAVGIDGLYRIRRDGVAEITALPELEEVAGIGASFEHPDFVLVITGINGRLSISGGTPLLVPR